MYEVAGFIVHFFSKEKIELLSTLQVFRFKELFLFLFLYLEQIQFLIDHYEVQHYF